jgi:ABC-type dipeptide/oligopeptide/nickel transport system ATPase subunit
MMYITKVRLKDVRCFEEAVIDLSDCEPGTSILIAGNNGIGKSAVLRAIAMGLCDRDSAASLLRESEGDFIRKGAEQTARIAGDKQAVIEIDLVDQNDRKPWKITTTVKEYKELIIETVKQTYRAPGGGTSFKAFSPFWNRLFLTAYGAGLRTAGTAKYSDYFAVDAVYSLFRYDAPLQDPELAWRRLIAASQRAAKEKRSRTRKVETSISILLKHVLDLDAKAQILLEPNGIYVKEKDELIPLDAVGDGHKSLVKLTLDILVWYLLKQNYDALELGEDREWVPIPLDKEGRPDVRGIVIIDEVEQHLHPKLQRQILRTLDDKFPQVQFIMTTHSPLCVSGTADAGKHGQERYKVFSLRRSDGAVTVNPRSIPRGLRTDQILLDYFELETTLNLSTEEKLERLQGLMSIPEARRTSTEKRQITNLLKEIEEYDFGLAESVRDREFQKSALAFLSKQGKKQ